MPSSAHPAIRMFGLSGVVLTVLLLIPQTVLPQTRRSCFIMECIQGVCTRVDYDCPVRPTPTGCGGAQCHSDAQWHEGSLWDKDDSSESKRWMQGRGTVSSIRGMRLYLQQEIEPPTGQGTP